jgi:hypothetical protein
MIQTRQIIDQVFVHLQEDPENCICIDCGDQSSIFVSIPNGAFVCSVCANHHMALGPDFLCKSILSNDWTVPELKKVASGGNSALKEYLFHYEIQEFPIENKYKTKAMTVYRRMLSEIAHGNNFDEELLEVHVGKEIEGADSTGWFQGILMKSKNIGCQALEKLESFKEKTKNKVEGLGIVNHIRNSSFTIKTSEVLEHITEDVQNKLISKTKKIKNETFLLLQNFENMIGCRNKVNT